MTADKPGSRHQRRSLCRCLGESLDRSNSTPPTGATSRSRPPGGGAFLIPRPLAVVDYLLPGRQFGVGSSLLLPRKDASDTGIPLLTSSRTPSIWSVRFPSAAVTGGGCLVRRRHREIPSPRIHAVTLCDAGPLFALVDPNRPCLTNAARRPSRTCDHR